MPTAQLSHPVDPIPQPAGLEFVVRKFDLKMLGDGEVGSAPRFSGHGAVFHNVDSVGDIIVPGAFADGLADFLQDGFIGGLNHNWDNPIGNPLAAYEDAKGLYLETGDLVDTAHGSDVAKLLRARVIKKLSIGFHVAHDGEQRIVSMDALQAYWKGHQYTPSQQDVARANYAIKVGSLGIDEDGDLRPIKGVRMLRKINLYEVSPVTRPANMLADVTAVKSTRSAKAEKVSRKDRPVTRRTLFDHSQDVVTAIGEIRERVLDRAEFRSVVPRHADESKAGAMFSRQNRTALETVSASCKETAAAIDDILARDQRSRPADEPATAKADAQPETAAASPQGEPATPAVPHPDPVEPGQAPPAPTPPEAAAPPDHDEADIFAQYAATQYALTMATVGSLIRHA